jgi:hypothetical protein
MESESDDESFREILEIGNKVNNNKKENFEICLSEIEPDSEE